MIPACRVRYGIVRHEQAVGIFFLLCILLGGCHLRCELVGVHCPGVGKGDIMHCFVRQRAVRRAGNVLAGEVKVIGAAGGKGELLCEIKLCRQLGYIWRDTFTRRVQVPVAAKPLKAAAGISIRAGQTFGRRCGKALAGFHNDLDSIRAAAQFSAAKVKGNGFQPVRAQRAGVQDFKDGAETEEREGERSIGAGIFAGQIVPAANHTVR